jgi:hypothetical protein
MLQDTQQVATSIDDPGSRLCADRGQHPTTPDG